MVSNLTFPTEQKKSYNNFFKQIIYSAHKEPNLRGGYGIEALWEQKKMINDAQNDFVFILTRKCMGRMKILEKYVCFSYKEFSLNDRLFWSG